MGMEYDSMADISPIVVDIETCGLPNATDFLEPVTPDARLKDPLKIIEDIAAKTAARDGKTALDWNVGRIVAIAWWTTKAGTQVYLGKDEHSEATALMLFWREAKGRTIITFNGRGFDLPFMIQRSRYLGLGKYPVLDLRPYGGGQGNVDLYLELTFGKKDTPCMRTTLTAFCRRFGIPVNDDISGKEIPALVAAGEWEKVAAHCSADVALTVALARKLGLISQPQPAEEAAAVA